MAEHQIEQIRLQIAAVILAAAVVVAKPGIENSGHGIQFLSAGLFLLAIFLGLYIISLQIAFSPFLDKFNFFINRKSIIAGAHLQYNLGTLFTAVFLVIFVAVEIRSRIGTIFQDPKDVAIFLLVIALVIAIIRPKIKIKKDKAKPKRKPRKKKVEQNTK